MKQKIQQSLKRETKRKEAIFFTVQGILWCLTLLFTVPYLDSLNRLQDLETNGFKTKAEVISIVDQNDLDPMVKYSYQFKDQSYVGESSVFRIIARRLKPTDKIVIFVHREKPESSIALHSMDYGLTKYFVLFPAMLFAAFAVGIFLRRKRSVHYLENDSDLPKAA